MINLFQFASNDQSLVYLNSIFGGMYGVIAPGTTLTLLGTMFKTFNSVILAVGVLIVVYVTVVGVMKTAHEGKFMGEKWNNLWMPIRIVLGIALLIPTGTGYSIIQVVMMWVVVQGIGAADTLWNTALSYVYLMGSPYAQSPIPTVGPTQTLQSLFQGLTCDASSRQSSDPTNGKVTTGRYFCNVTGSYCNPEAPAFNPSATTYSLGPSGACGTLTYCDSSAAGSCQDPNSVNCQACKGQISALQSIIPVLAGIANDFVKADYDYRAFYYNSAGQVNTTSWPTINEYCSAQGIAPDQCCIPAMPPSALATLISMGYSPSTGSCQANSTAAFPSPIGTSGDPTNTSSEAVNKLYAPYMIQPPLKGNFITTAVGLYTSALSNALASYIAQQGQTPLSGVLGEAQKTGWILAGAYYYAVAQTNNSNLNASIPTFSYATPELSASSSNAMSPYRNNYLAAATLISAAGGTEVSGFSNANQAFGPVGDLFGSATQGVVDTLLSAIGNNGSSAGTIGVNIVGSNPLNRLQQAGMGLLITAEIIFVAFLTVTAVLGIAGNINVEVMGNWIMNALGPMTQLAYMVIVPLLYGLLGILVVFGGLLGVYTPLIPYVIFTFGAVGWMISTVEMMVAGPLVALGVLSPRGEHELLGKAEPAIGQLFSIFLRPSLMVFGMMAAMLLSSAAVGMVNSAFGTVMTGIGTMDPLGLIIFLAAYVTLVVSVLNKCFAAIYLIPENVMGWISMHGAKYGEEGGLGEVKRSTEAAGHGISGAGSKAGGLTGGSIKAAKEKIDKDKEVQDKEAPTLNIGDQPPKAP